MVGPLRVYDQTTTTATCYTLRRHAGLGSYRALPSIVAVVDVHALPASTRTCTTSWAARPYAAAAPAQDHRCTPQRSSAQQPAARASLRGRCAAAARAS